MDWLLPHSFLHQLLATCDAPDVARMACVSRRFLDLTSHDSLWRDLCLRHFDVSTPHDHAGHPHPSYRETFRAWHANFAKYPRSIVIRAKRLWQGLRLWLESNFPEAAGTLQAGASEEELDEVGDRLGWKLPTAVRVLYRFCNGQDTRWMDLEAEDEALPSQHSFCGLLGGYHFYGHVVNVHLLPLRQLAIFSQQFLLPWGTATGSQHAIVASSFNLNKFFLLDCEDGMVYVGTKNLVSNGEMMPCLPFASTQEDAMLRWLETYALHLETGLFSLRKHDVVSSISTYPEREPLCTQAITCGVQVQCSAVFVPELSSFLDDDGDDGTYLFSYFVRMCLLPSGIGSSYHSFSSCQLHKRHWKVWTVDGILTEVNAEAVIGLFPLLRSDEEAFTYTSCTALNAPFGSIEGGFTFVPGKLSCQEGAHFLARVARFPLEVPKFIF